MLKASSISFGLGKNLSFVFGSIKTTGFLGGILFVISVGLGPDKTDVFGITLAGS